MPNGYIYDQAAMSRSEAILGAEINTDDPVYDQPPLSRIEYLLKTLEERTRKIIRLKDVVPTVDDLPETGNEDGDLYFVGPNDDGEYEEYVYFEEKGAFEKLGSTDIDVSQFVMKAGDTMTGPLGTTNHFIGALFGGRLFIGNDAQALVALQTFLASERTAEDIGTFYTAIRQLCPSAQIEYGVGLVNGTQNYKDFSTGFSVHWKGSGPSWSLPFANAAYHFSSDGDAICVFDDGFTIKKRNVFYSDETGYMPIKFKGVAASTSELPDNPENGWAYLSARITAETYESVVINYMYSSELNAWIGPGPGATSVTLTNQRSFTDAFLTTGYTGTGYDVENDELLDAAGLIPDNALLTKAFIESKIASGFEPALLSYIDNHIKTQAEYDQLQDKTGFWFIKDPVT